MRSLSARSRRLISFAPAHWAVAFLSLAGAAATQTGWNTDLGERGISSWWPPVAAVLFATTAWLASAAWLHVELASSAKPPLLPSRLLVNLASDLLVAILAGAILLQGSQSHILLAGLWIVPPTLLTVATPSFVLLLTAAVGARHRLPGEQSGDYPPPRTGGRWRTAIVLALLVSLLALGAQPLPGITSR